MDVPVVAQAQGGAAHEGAHVQGQDRDEQGLPALQVAVKQDGYENDLQGRERRTSQRGGTEPVSQSTADCLHLDETDF